jgi:hypothetical protein
MGQYYRLVNLDKKEFVNPRKLGIGLKAWEILANHPGIGAAMIVLCISHPEPRGGGDLNMTSELAQRVIGRWAGDRVTLVGDYAEAGDLPKRFNVDTIYGRCIASEDESHLPHAVGVVTKTLYRDISEDVRAVIGAELSAFGHFTTGHFVEWVPNKEER